MWAMAWEGRYFSAVSRCCSMWILRACRFLSSVSNSWSHNLFLAERSSAASTSLIQIQRYYNIILEIANIKHTEIVASLIHQQAMLYNLQRDFWFHLASVPVAFVHMMDLGEIYSKCSSNQVIGVSTYPFQRQHRRRPYFQYWWSGAVAHFASVPPTLFGWEHQYSPRAPRDKACFPLILEHLSGIFSRQWILEMRNNNERRQPSRRKLVPMFISFFQL